MSDFANVFKDLNTYSKEVLISIIVLAGFWTIPFMLFKPEFFDFPFYAQIALIFALTIIWLVTNLIVSVHILDKYVSKNANPILLATVIAIVTLNFSILVGYYYSTSFTAFLRYAYSIMLGYFIGQLIFFTILELRKDK